MTDWVIKNFHKSQAVKAYVYGADKKIRVYWRIPDGNTITIGESSYIITVKEQFLSGKNVPSFLYVWNIPEPIDVYLNRPENMTAQDFDTAISAQVASEIFRAIKSKTDVQLVTIVVCAVGFLALGVGLYFVYKQNQELKTTIDELATILRNIAGV